jgi:uncharacterized membrane protein YfcA
MGQPDGRNKWVRRMDLITGALDDALDGGFAVAALVALISGVLHGYTGFGGALMMVPLLTLLWGPVPAMASTHLIAVFATAQLYPAAARAARWRELAPILLATLAATPLGVLLVYTLDPALIRLGMGAFILAFAGLTLAGWRYRGPRGRGAGLLVGAVAGGVNGAAGVGGPPLALYFVSAPEPAAVQRANIILGVGAIIVTAIAALAAAGAYDAPLTVRAILLAPFYAAGVWLGVRLFAHAPSRYFRRIALILLMASGLAVILG